MKKTLSIFVILLILFCLPAVCSAQDDIVRVYINGEILPVSGKLYCDSTVIPVRAFLEKAGFTVEWSDAEEKVTASKDGYVINLWSGSDRMTVNEAIHTMPCPVLEQEGTTYVPVRSIAENTGFTVRWYPRSSSAVLSDGSDSMTYYEDASSLLPELGAVVGGASFAEIAEDDVNGIYYTYPNYVEDMAYTYGDYLSSKLGYEYDSMLLGDGYSKIYVYTLGDVTTELEVRKVDEVPYIYVYPDTTVPALPEAVEEEQPADSEPEGTIPAPEAPEVQPPVPEAPSDGSAGAEFECYPDTDIPKYNAVMNSPLLRTNTLDGGQTLYAYEGDSFDAMTYMNYLTTLGYYNYDMDIGSGFSITYTMLKGEQFVVIMTSMFFDEIYVVPGK